MPVRQDHRKRAFHLLVLAKVADLAHTRLFQLPAEAELPEVQVDES